MHITSSRGVMQKEVHLKLRNNTKKQQLSHIKYIGSSLVTDINNSSMNSTTNLHQICCCLGLIDSCTSVGDICTSRNTYFRSSCSCTAFWSNCPYSHTSALRQNCAYVALSSVRHPHFLCCRSSLYHTVGKHKISFTTTIRHLNNPTQ